MNLKYEHLCTTGTRSDNGSKQISCAVRSDWLTVRKMEGTIKDVVYCTSISQNYHQEVSQVGLGISRRPSWRIINTRHLC
jgi:hypothetical protein